MRRFKLMLGVLALLCAALLSGGQPTAATTTPAAFAVTGVDLHGGGLAKFGSTYYLYGEEEACGYQWYVPGNWCGFGVSTATSLAGPWSTPTLLFPTSEVDPSTGKTFNQICGTDTAQGCWNVHMLQRTSDGVFLIWFNAVEMRTSTTTNAFYVLGCNGPAGPCGQGAGAPHGSTHRPTMHQCNGSNGDFTVGQDATGPAVICSYGGVLSEERLDAWWANGNGTGSTSLGGLSSVEGPGVYQDPTTGTWILTMSDPLCGYCSGTGTGYATASSLMGPWTAPANTSVAPSTTPIRGRRDLSATSCGGPPRRVSVVDGQAWQGIDLWAGQRNEAGAGLVFEPLTYTGATTGTAGDGQTWTPPFTPWSCP
jgi:hypothetical protein